MWKKRSGKSSCGSPRWAERLSEWTIEAELRNIAGEADLADARVKLGLYLAPARLLGWRG